MILITGSTGVLGNALVSELATRNERFECLSHAELDLRDRDQVIERFREIAPRLVYHLAARVHGLGGNLSYPADMYTDNIRINTNVIDAAHLAGCRTIVAASTVAIYPHSVTMPTRESSLWDGSPHSGEASYGHSKRAMLAQLQAYAAQYGMNFAYPILTNIYGPHDRFDRVNGHVVPSLIAKFHAAVREGTNVTIWGTGAAQRDFIYSGDAARALVLLADKLPGPVNVATGVTVKIRALVDILQNYTNLQRIDWDSSKSDGQILRSYDVSRLQGLGFEPSVSLEEGIRRTYDWYAETYPSVRA